MSNIVVENAEPVAMTNIVVENAEPVAMSMILDPTRQEVELHNSEPNSLGILPLFPVIPTALTKIKQPNNALSSFRMICDSGAQSNMITESAFKRASQFKQPCKAKVVGANGIEIRTKGQVILELHNHATEELIVSARFVIIPDLRVLMPQESFTHLAFPGVSPSSLADPDYNQARG